LASSAEIHISEQIQVFWRETCKTHPIFRCRRPYRVIHLTHFSRALPERGISPFILGKRTYPWLT